MTRITYRSRYIIELNCTILQAYIARTKHRVPWQNYISQKFLAAYLICLNLGAPLSVLLYKDISLTFHKLHNLSKDSTACSRPALRTVYTLSCTYVFDSVILHWSCVLSSKESTCNFAKFHPCIAGNRRAQTPNGALDDPWAGHVGSVLCPVPSIECNASEGLGTKNVSNMSDES